MHLTCPELSTVASITHGFFTRVGGVSEGGVASLNCGYGSGDDFEKVSENRRLVANAMGGRLCTVRQIHSSAAVIVNEPWEHKDAPQADALVTDKPGIVLGILTADCLPILFADDKNKIIGAAHAGWKGAFSGVIEDTLAKMQSLGAKSEEIIATIGPAISADSYEVGAEFFEKFMTTDTKNQEFFKSSPQDDGKYFFNLPAYAVSRLKKAGVGRANIIAQDTYLNDNLFFSYRRSCKRNEPAYGRQISTIMLKP